MGLTRYLVCTDLHYINLMVWIVFQVWNMSRKAELDKMCHKDIVQKARFRSAWSFEPSALWIDIYSHYFSLHQKRDIYISLHHLLFNFSVTLENRQASKAEKRTILADCVSALSKEQALGEISGRQRSIWRAYQHIAYLRGKKVVWLDTAVCSSH